MSNKLGLMIDYYRKRDGLTLNELGEKLNKSSSAVSRWISGDRSPMVDDLIRLTELFNTDVQSLLYGRQVTAQFHDYVFYETTINPDDENSTSEPHTITLSDCVMGQYAGNPNVIVMKVTTDSLSNSIPTGSLIAVKESSIKDLNDGDMVVLHTQDKITIKRYMNDTANSRFIFRPHSHNPMYTDFILPYDQTDQIINIGKVVVTISQYE